MADDLITMFAEGQRSAATTQATGFLEGFAGVAPEPVEDEEDERGVLGDIGAGIMEAPGQIVGGALDAAEGALGGIAAFDEWASDRLNLPKLQLFDPESGEFDLELLSPEEGQEAKVMLPEVGEADTVTGGLVRGMSQFLTGFAGGAKALGGLKAATKSGAVAKGSGAAVISDFAAFDGHEARLADLIEAVPELSNPVTEYLKSDMDDSELEGRLKNVAEGVLSDAVLGGFIGVIGQIRKARAARAEIGGETYQEATRRLTQDNLEGQSFAPSEADTEALAALRGIDAPLVTRGDEATTLIDDLTPEQVGGDASADTFINWARIDSPEDVKAAMQQMADQAKDEIDGAARGTRSNPETELAADQLDAWKILEERRHGQPLNAEQSLAARRLWASSGEHLIEAARVARSAPTAVNRFAFRRALAQHGAIQREIIAARTETARALQQWTIPAGGDKEMMQALNSAVEQFGGDVSDEFAERIVRAADEGNQAAIDQMARKGPLASTFDAIAEYWTNSILSGPKTHLVNAISNTGVIGLLQAERVAAAGIGAIRGGADRHSVREAAAAIHGVIAALPDALRFAGRAFRDGRSGFGMGKVELPYKRALSSESLGGTSSARFNAVMNQPAIARGIDFLGMVTTIPGRALGGADEFFKTVNFRADIHAQAVRRAAQEARSGDLPEHMMRERIAELIQEPDEAMRVQARETAQYATFTNDAGRYAKMLTDLRYKAPILRFVIPFVNTPANILRFATERSPAAPLLGDVRADIAAGGVRRDMALARIGLGSMAMAWGFDAAMNGKITGSGPSNPNEKAALRRTGWQPYSVKVGDRYYAYNRLDPIGMQLGVAAEFAEIALNAEEDPGQEWDEAAYRAVGAVGQNMLDRTYLSGVSDLVAALSEPTRNAPYYFERLASSFVPTASREVAVFQHPEMKRATNTLERIKERIPAFREDVQTRHDLWGRPITYQSGLGSGYDAVSPIYSSRSDPEPIDEELIRIDYFPGRPSSSITVDGERYSLRNEPEVYERYVVLQGATPAVDMTGKLSGKLSARGERLKHYGDRSLRQYLNDLVTGKDARSAEYASQDASVREDMIAQAIRDFRSVARSKIVEENPAIFGGNP